MTGQNIQHTWFLQLSYTSMTMEMHVHDCIATNKTVLIISLDVVFFLLQLSRIHTNTFTITGASVDIESLIKVNSC